MFRTLTQLVFLHIKLMKTYVFVSLIIEQILSHGLTSLKSIFRQLESVLCFYVQTKT